MGRATVVLLVGLFCCWDVLAQECVVCHKRVTPNIVADWQLSKHSQSEINCSICHGDRHNSARDVAKAQIPAPETCAFCHEARVDQFKKGKHALAWSSMKAMPTAHWQPMARPTHLPRCANCD